jgi:hypothetical protein
MADETFPLRYKLKRKTTAQWASQNPVLLAGEPGIEVLSDGSEKIKYGDGVKTWSALSYAAGGGSGPALSSAAPQALGASAAPGTSVDASRADHVHPRPTAGQVGADPAGTAAAAVAAHEAAADAHPGYLTATEGNAAYATAAQGALAATAIQPGNAALSDAREWSADTISQAEAEAGTATTRRAFTALRVFQAIASWWNGSAAKTKLDGIQDGAQANVATNLSYDATTRNLASSTGSPAVLPLFGSSAAGLVPASGGGTSNFLRADGTFAAPPSGGGSPGGSSGQVQFNNGGAFGGLSTLTADGSGNLTLSAKLTNSYNAAASAPAKLFSGTWFTGGTSTTTKPHLLIEPAGTTSTNWSTAGTGLGVNAPVGFTGNLIDLQINGTSNFSVLSGIISKCYQINLPQVTGASGIQIALGGGAEGVYLGSDLSLSWSDGNGTGGFSIFSGSRSLRLFRDAANTLAQRNGTNPQVHRIYNTFTSATNFERAKVEWVSNILRIGTEKGAAGGTARDMELQTDGTTRITLKADGAILFSGIPTTNPNVAGQLWNDGGTLKISA